MLSFRPMARATMVSQLLYRTLPRLCLPNSNYFFSTNADVRQTPLHVAAWNNDIERIEVLLNLRKNLRENLPENLRKNFDSDNSDKKELPGPEILDACDLKGETPLHIATKKGCNEAVELLLQNGASVSARADNLSTPLHVAISSLRETKNQKVVKMLLDYNANANLSDDKMQTPLHIAIDVNNIEIIKVLLAAGGNGKVDLEDENRCGETAVHIAAKNGYDEALRILLGHGADVDAKDDDGNTPLHLAVWNSHLSSVNVLLEYKASCTASHQRHTPIHIAAAKNSFEIMESLLNFTGPEKLKSDAQKLKLETKNMYGETPLHVAVKNGCKEAARVLLEHGAPVDAKDSRGRTPLYLAVWFSIQSEDTSTVETLLEFKPDCNAADNEGLTPRNLLSQGTESDKLHEALVANLEDHMKREAVEAFADKKNKMAELEEAISGIIGVDDLKVQLTKWAKGMLLDEKRAALGLKIGARSPPHMAFLGSPGTGKSMVARVLGKLLKIVGVLPTDKVTKVQRTDLVGQFVGHTGPKTREKIQEAEGGILFVDEAYRLIPRHNTHDFGKEALEEIMAVMDSGKVVVIFAGYNEPMKRVIASNQGFARRVTKIFSFTDYTTRELAQIVNLKMNKQSEDSPLYGFKLHPDCTEDALSELIERETTEIQRNKLNGGLVDTMLRTARDNLDSRLYCDTEEVDDLGTASVDDLLAITLEDLEAALKLLPRADVVSTGMD